MTSPKLAAYRPDAVAVAIAMGFLGILGLFVALLSARQLPVIGDNAHAGSSLAVGLPPGHTVCQRETTIPGGITRLGVALAVAGASRSGPLSLTIKGGVPGTVYGESAPRGIEASGRLDGVATGHLAFALSRPLQAGEATICLHNEGSAVLNFLGDVNAVPTGLVTGELARGLIGFIYETGPATSWWQALGTIAHRFALAKAPIFGSWTLWAVIVAVAAISIVAVEGLRRALRS